MYILCAYLQPPATGFANGWWTAYKLFMHYPVDNIITESRDTFYAGDYQVELVPLKPFPTSDCNFSNFLDGAFELGNVQDMRLQESKMILWARKDPAGRRITLAEPPLPVVNGVAHPHGAVLDFQKRPVPLVHDAALVKFLRYRGVRLSTPQSLVNNLTRRPDTHARTHPHTHKCTHSHLHTRAHRVPTKHPRTTTKVRADPDDDEECAYTVRGLEELVHDSVKYCRAPLTAEEAEVFGSEDPIAWRYTKDPISLAHNFKKFKAICVECALDDVKIEDWFGVNNTGRFRGKKLFRNGHVDWKTVSVVEGVTIVGNRPLYLFKASITASQRSRSYDTVLAYDIEKKRIIAPPATICGCTVHLGSGCSHALSIACTIILVTLLRDWFELRVLPPHMDALQRVAMTINYAYGYGSIERNPLLAKTKLPRTKKPDGTMVRRRDVPDPIMSWVHNLLTVWRQRGAGAAGPNQMRLNQIKRDASEVIKRYPRGPKEQLVADHMRERLYQAYASGKLGGWDDETPPLMLHYLVHTRRARTDRIRGRPLPPPPPKVYKGSKRCPQCKKVVPGARTAVCPHCNWMFSKTGVYPSLGNIARVLSLYDTLAGRWQVQAWAHGDADDVLVRLYGEEGMVGHYPNRLHEEGDQVEVRVEGDVWEPAVVVEARPDVYVVMCGQRRTRDRSTWEGHKISVRKSMVRDTVFTPSNSWFRIQKCARSVTLVHGGKRKRTRRGGRGNGSTGHPYEYQWNLHAESTEDRLVWTGGGFGPHVKIVWLRDTTTRASATTVYAVPGFVRHLPKKITCPTDRKREHCACGDKTCNDLAKSVEVILKKACSYARPTRRLTATSIAKLSELERSKVLRQQKIHEKVMSWRKECNVEGMPPKRVRFNELHYPLKFLRAMKKLGKKAVPRRVTVAIAKQCDMFHPSLVVGKQVVTVPTLSTAVARVRRTTTPNVPLIHTPVVVSPVVKRRRHKGTSVTTRKRVRLSSRAQRAEARANPAGKPNEATRNILVVGLVAHTREHVQDFTRMRDQTRIDALNREYDTVFAMAMKTEHRDVTVCVEAKLGPRGAPKLVTLMNQRRHKGKQLHCICLEYVRMPNWYYRNMILDSSPEPEQTMAAFIDTLRNANLLAPGCTILFARMDVDARWEKAVNGLKARYGAMSLEYVPASANPLVAAAAITEGTYYDPHPYTAPEELARLTNKSPLPFCQLTIHARGGPSPAVRSLSPPPSPIPAAAAPTTTLTSPIPAAAATTSTFTPSPSAGSDTLSPEGAALLEPLQSKRRPSDQSSPYVAALEATVDRLAAEKARLTIKLKQATVKLTQFVKNLENELGPMTETEAAQFWAGVRETNPVVNNTSEPIFGDLVGLVYPKNWGGTAKYNLTKPTMSRKTCFMLYGMPCGFEELCYLITEVWFPDIQVRRSRMEMNTNLTQFERALATLQLFKSGDAVAEIAHHWGVQARTMGRYLEEWAPKWEEASANLALLDPTLTLFEKSQPVGYDYGMPIACIVDGSCNNIGTSREYSAKARSSYCEKSGTQSAQGVTWSTGPGLVLLVTSLFCGRTSEKELVRLHQRWLDIFPDGYGRLVDRGFTFCTHFYKHLLRAFVPAFVNRKTGDLTFRQVLEARKQSADRYTCEVVYSRVKKFRILTGTCPLNRCQYLNAAWMVAHMAANLYKPLAVPDSMHTWCNDKLLSAYYAY